MPENDAPISKTQAIKQYLAEHPDAFPREVAEALLAQGIRVEPARVSIVRTMLEPPKPDDEEPQEPPRHIHITITPPPERSTPKKKKSPKKKPAASGGTADVKAVFDAIVGMTDAFCRDHLNDEYAMLCRNLAAALARKRPSPLLRGQLETWAVGIIRTIGWVNFLDDSSNKPHLKLPCIDKAFGVAESTGQGKSKLIRNMLKIRTFDPKWTLPSRLDDNPMAWMISVNGFIMDIRAAPRELQVEAFERGLIPYIPADRGSDSDEDE
jgi:hypothetical protein